MAGSSHEVLINQVRSAFVNQIVVYLMEMTRQLPQKYRLSAYSVSTLTYAVQMSLI